MNVTGSQSTREVLAGLGEKMLGRRRMWRLGRLLYTHARNDVANFIGSNGEAQMHEFEEGGVTNSLHPDPFMRGKPVNVKLDTVDGYCARENIHIVHMLKVDAEGHDLAVVRGAIGMLREGRVKVAQVEYNVRWVYSRTYLKDAFDLIEGLPYRLGKLTPGRVDFYDAWHPELERFFEANYVIVHRDLAGRIPSHDVTFDEYNTGA